MSFLPLLLLEVMDKESPLWFVLVLFGGLGILGLLLSRKRPILAAPIMVLAMIAGVRQLIELNDPYVGSSIRSEAGLSYVILSYAAMAVALILPLLGAFLGRRARARVSGPRGT
jgi:hypothetical protein